MHNQDARMMQMAKMRKAIKAWILELRSARGGCHGNLLPSTYEFAATSTARTAGYSWTSATM
jgi:hypothetical protein